jgi:hypothetical protein
MTRMPAGPRLGRGPGDADRDDRDGQNLNLPVKSGRGAGACHGQCHESAPPVAPDGCRWPGIAKAAGGDGDSDSVEVVLRRRCGPDTVTLGARAAAHVTLMISRVRIHGARACDGEGGTATARRRA